MSLVKSSNNNVYKLYNSGLLQSIIKYEIEIEIINNSIKNIDNNSIKTSNKIFNKTNIVCVSMF